jgi:hypothetical protein
VHVLVQMPVVMDIEQPPSKKVVPLLALPGWQ